MRQKKYSSITALVLCLVLCLGIFLPTRASSPNLYFTSINDNLLPLTDDTMPVTSGGAIYVPYTVFDSGSTGIDLGLYCSYSRNNNTVSLSNKQLSEPRLLVFDLNSGSAHDGLSMDPISARAIIRNGRPYLPLNTVCNFYGLEYSFTSLPTVAQGYLIRIKSPAAVLSDSRFIDAAASLIDRRLKEYNHAHAPKPKPSNPTPNNPTPSVPTPPPLEPPVEEPEVPGANVSAYLSVLCRTGDGVDEILNTLSRTHQSAMFFLSEDMLTQQGQLVHRILGSGHSIGLIADGGSWAESEQQLKRSNELLARLAFVEATAVYVPRAQRTEARQAGWVSWNETMLVTPGPSEGPKRFSANVIRKLSGRTRPAYLTLSDSAAMGRVLGTFLDSLEEQHFTVQLPLETRI